MITEEFKDRLLAAIERADRDQLVVFQVSPTEFTVPGSKGDLYTVTVSGPRFFDLVCNCPGGAHPVCKHRAAVIRARKYHVTAEWTPDGQGAQLHMDFRPVGAGSTDPKP